MRAPLLAAVAEILNVRSTSWPQLQGAWHLLQDDSYSHLDLRQQQILRHHRPESGHATLTACATVNEAQPVAQCQQQQHQAAEPTHQQRFQKEQLDLIMVEERHGASSRTSNSSLHISQLAAAVVPPQQHQQQQQQQKQQRVLLQVGQCFIPQLQHHHQMCGSKNSPCGAAITGAQNLRCIHSSSNSRIGRESKSRLPLQKPKPQPQKKAEPRHNEQIKAPRLLVIFPDNTKQVMDNAAAKAAAASLNLDLVEFSAQSDVPVVRILDYRQYRYKQQKKSEEAEKQKRLAQKMATPKEMQFSARIGDHDLEFKLKKVLSMLEDGYKVQLTVKYRRDEDAAAAEALDYLLARIQSECAVEAGAKQAQRRAVTLLVKLVGPKQ